MIPEKLDLVARRNADFLEEYVFTENGVPLDLTGCTPAMHVRLYGNAPGMALISLGLVGFDPSVEGVAVDGANGLLAVRIYPATLNALPAPKEAGEAAVFAYDLRITWPDGVVEVLMDGAFTVNPGVTR